MKKQNLIGQTITQMEKLMTDMGERSYRGRQLFTWLYSVRQYDFDLMTDLSKECRKRLAEKYEFTVPSVAHEDVSTDGTRKFLFDLNDGEQIETVLIPDPEADRCTVCVSSQVGCALGCRFCATATLGFTRNLSVGEILGQLIRLRDKFGEDAFTNVVFMGMGEPMMNLDNVLAAVGILSADAGMSHAAKKVTISTAGVIPAIRKLADSGSKARLAVSLNAATQEKRVQIMPVSRKYPLDELMKTLEYYTTKTGARVTFEYALFAGFNDTKEDIKAISRVVRGIPCKINLLAYNRVNNLPFERPSDEKLDWFARQLYPKVPAVTVRRSRGDDIAAACGQLAGRAKKAGESR
ncbi:MAG: 23S rRNA (adenine(2503)-C(2))-methyltransferase RlmN [candidate division Zixibacteria bacterium]|nr:23S rRNA (adenine(2503)-C(2))-methyltransferase RlmN [candidate division Zixibacteria bacterium]MDH3937798.1 23S rRNA (adenine(2503)-C(2))-methyltransferase RlmN [candidate division Zixibacteria bacterium]MDH4034609.1 23S rRNA (adenine(2503)-C(2))-methyltransferase RlmN [candidate division Zixibacteria bacterium]